MDRFETINTITGAEVFDSLTGRTVDMYYNREAARNQAAKLNRMIGKAGKAPSEGVLAALIMGWD